MADEDNWRLVAELGDGEKAGRLDDLVGRTRERKVAKEAGAEVPADVVITHDGARIFAYAASEQSVRRAREAISAHAPTASAVISQWDAERDEWRQVDPPLSAEEQQREEALERDGEQVETRTMVATAGREIRSELEQSMQEWAEKLELTLTISEHRHLLTYQVLFEVTGPKRKIDEFAAGLRAEEHATMRTEYAVMASPL